MFYLYQRYPNEKDHANTWLAQALVGTTWISAARICEILTTLNQRLVTPKRAGARGSSLLIAPEINSLGWYHAVICTKFGVETTYFRQ